MDLHSPKTNSWSLKMDGWKITFLLEQAYFRGLCWSWGRHKILYCTSPDIVGYPVMYPSLLKNHLFKTPPPQLIQQEISTSPRCCDKTQIPKTDPPWKIHVVAPTTGMRKSRVNDNHGSGEIKLGRSLYQVDSRFSKKYGGYTHPIW